MSRRFDRFLRHAPVHSAGPTLGRVFNVTRESWKLTDDPKVIRPRRERVASGRTASDAADLARASAESFADHGFHKPSGAWWASDGTDFHRYVVHTGRRGPPPAVLIATGLAGAALAILHLSGGRRRRTSGKAD
ncbi:hypothetical protein [Phenylobacterium soli]|uniref:Uncharacterized protein n=1 Tax=Phenylobacterium soli TaxID=2170551 RepID=A0A328ACP2_9CAUL|nr:hypothetical protein [Phenylobacterium soli]RAK51154.1 hypothetical protein DJ017_19530 [Phenylobacterium soli]